jgi:hypothetical protein
MPKSNYYRHFSFGKNVSDYRRCTALLSIPHDLDNMKDDAVYIVRMMPSSQDYQEGLLAQLQRDGFVVVVKEEKEIPAQNII